MGKSSAQEITRLLQAHRQGDREAFDRLVPLVYRDLQRIARRQRSRAPAHIDTLNTTALVHEAYFELADETGVDWQDRVHFFAIAARAMRRIVVDYARYRGAAKRGGGKPAATLDPSQLATSTGKPPDVVTLLAVDRALRSLSAFNERLTRVVECRFFVGLSQDETARALGVSLRTVQRDWTRARAWLRHELAHDGEV